jgi:hypothetical protein
MRGTLLLAVLTIKSSYSRNLEIPVEGAGDTPDTLQWWFGDGGCYRIRTYAIDHDIHVFQIGDSPNTTLELARTNNLKNYGDVIKMWHEIDVANWTDASELHAAFGRIGFASRIEGKPGQFMFWKPDDAQYATKSRPE